MVNGIFAEMESLYKTGVIAKKTSFYFSIDDVRKTIILDTDSCSVIDGKTGKNVDCVCKTGKQFFLKIWNEGYTPGMRDFMSGAIKSNAPHLLRDFMNAFGK